MLPSTLDMLQQLDSKPASSMTPGKAAYDPRVVMLLFGVVLMCVGVAALVTRVPCARGRARGGMVRLDELSRMSQRTGPLECADAEEGVERLEARRNKSRKPRSLPQHDDHVEGTDAKGGVGRQEARRHRSRKPRLLPQHAHRMEGADAEEDVEPQKARSHRSHKQRLLQRDIEEWE